MAIAERKSHKDWFDRDAAKALARQVCAVHKSFDNKRFVRLCGHRLNELEFNARVRQFSNALRETLPASYPQAVMILEQSLPEVLPDCDSVTDGWLQWPLGQFIADNGLSHFDESMHCMVELTQRFSAEYAIRPFVKHQPEETFAFLYTKLSDKSPHVRRWCSEGCRTRLPWGEKLSDLVADPTPIIPILDALKDDPEKYVQKSVANNLNDLSKDHPDKVLSLCRDWSKNSNTGRDWIVKQGLRSLLKAGDNRALKIMGFTRPRGINASLKLSCRDLHIGESIKINAVLHNSDSRQQNLMIDYVIHFQGKNSAKRQKVFKWKTVELKANEELTIEKNQPMKRTSIRELYEGKHTVELQINGEILARRAFELHETK